ncbi:histone PARylation factor 1 [Copidosoma floridanum]|uniref:histone PARylation factor 1 n=1 Tax=Copidosoma floridanum TaxID=29053 RepID=UPI0006C9912F|nr:histone PARylation factor 1 [Copidosoma floridanum]
MDLDEKKENMQEQSIEPEDNRVNCKYGDKCYQKNPEHRRRYKHPSKEEQEKDSIENNGASNGDNSNGHNKRKMSMDNGDKEDQSPVAKKQNTSDSNEEISSAEPQDNDIKVQSDEKVDDKKIVPVDSYEEAKKLIQKVFLVSMPNDFYKMYDFCSELNPSDPSNALKVADLKLVGPYDILNGLITQENANSTQLLTHWRYYYDPPEFQTTIKGNDKEGLHFGYWRDRPSSDPIFVALNSSEVSHKIKPYAENIFGAIVAYLEARLKKANPFEKTGFTNLIAKLKAYTKKHNINLDIQSTRMRSREKNVVTRTIHGAGIVCPYNKKSQVGYRELSVSDNDLLKIIKKINDAKGDAKREEARSELADVVRLATIAGDECDFGTCLELGHNLLSSGSTHVQNAALAMLNIAYTQLDRQEFLKIFEAHMKNRKKGCNLSALETSQSD